MVHLQKFHDKYAKDGLLVLVIAIHPEAAEAQKLTKKLGINYPVFQGEGSDLGKSYAFG